VDLIWEGLKDAVRILANGDYSVWEIAARSLLVSGSATAISLFIGISVGALLAFNRFPGRNRAFPLWRWGCSWRSSFGGAAPWESCG
jgi:ABC-type tungstate transport system substrate-binding protein